MTRLDYWQEKMQAKRKVTPWRTFVREVCSWVPLVFHNVHGRMSRFPQTDRVGQLVSFAEFDARRESLLQEELPVGDSFFVQFQRLLQSIALPALILESMENGDYCDVAGWSKNCYLSYGLKDCKNIAYTYNAKGSHNVFSSMMVWDNCSHVYESAAVINSSKVYRSKYIINSHDIRASSDLIGCHHCIACHHLENQSYCIANEQLDKELFAQEKMRLQQRYCVSDASPYDGLVDQRPVHIGSEDVSGRFVNHSHHVVDGFLSSHVRHGRNIVFAGGGDGYEHVYDCFNGGGGGSGGHMYAGASIGLGEHIYCCVINGMGNHCYYNFFLVGCSYCLGCIGLKNKQFCIFNKQYSKEEWYEKVDEIFGNMEADRTLGEFFPGWMNPFYFNDTVACLLDESFGQQEVEEMGYLWREGEMKVDIPPNVDVVSVAALSDYEGWIVDGEFVSVKRCKGETLQGGKDHAKWALHPDVLKVVIQDEYGDYYRIMPMEFKFLKQHGLPLPKKHWLRRLKGHFNF